MSPIHPRRAHHLAAEAETAARRVRHGYLSAHQRDRLATLLLLAATTNEPLPTPVADATRAALRALNEPGPSTV